MSVSRVQWCSKTTKLQDQDQDHLFFQDQDRSGQDQDYFFKTKTAFLKTIKLLTQNLKKRSLTEKIRPMMPVMPVLPSHAEIMLVTEKNCLLPAFWSSFASFKIRILRSEIGFA